MCYGVAGEDCLFRTSPSKLSLVLMKLWLVLCVSMVLLFCNVFCNESLLPQKCWRKAMGFVTVQGSNCLLACLFF